MKTIENRDGWNGDRKKILVTLWNEGQTASHIGSILGVSRSSVLGVVHRMGLPKRRNDSTPRLQAARQAAKPFNFASGRQSRGPLDQLPKEPYVARETIATAEHERLSFDALEAFDRRCRYPHGDTHPYTFCGLPTALGTSWCVHHLKVISPPLGAKIEAAMQGEGTGGFEPVKVLEAVE